MDISDIRWNEPARQKILDDADAVLREAGLTPEQITLLRAKGAIA